MIKVTFEDGTSELRPENCPHRHTLPDYYEGLFRAGLPATWEAAVGYAAIHSARRCGRGGNTVLVWRLNPAAPGEALTGAWRSCRIETVDEQIARLEGELAAERAGAESANKAWARYVLAMRDECDAVSIREDDYHRGERLADAARMRQGTAEQDLRALGVEVDALLADDKAAR